MQVTYGNRRIRVTKPVAGHLARLAWKLGEIIKEFRVTAETAAEFKAGSVIPVTCSKLARRSTQGTSICRLRRYHQAPQLLVRSAPRTVTPARINVPGSISMAQDPGRVFLASA